MKTLISTLSLGIILIGCAEPRSSTHPFVEGLEVNVDYFFSYTKDIDQTREVVSVMHVRNDKFNLYTFTIFHPLKIITYSKSEGTFKVEGDTLTLNSTYNSCFNNVGTETVLILNKSLPEYITLHSQNGIPITYTRMHQNEGRNFDDYFYNEQCL